MPVWSLPWSDFYPLDGEVSADFFLLWARGGGAPASHRSPGGGEESGSGESGPQAPRDSARPVLALEVHPGLRAARDRPGRVGPLDPLDARSAACLDPGLPRASRCSQRSGLSSGPRGASWTWCSCTWAGGARDPPGGASGLRPREG